jgi:AcrR family transcriptional regulator
MMGRAAIEGFGEMREAGHGGEATMTTASLSPKAVAEHDGGETSQLLAFPDFLARRLATSPPKLKGQRTSARLVIAAARVLEARGYHALRVIDVTTQAEVSEGSFYIYFKDKTAISVAVLTEFFEGYVSREMTRGGGRSVFSRIQSANRHWIALCRLNPGLIRCALQVGDYIPEFAEVAQRTGRIWYESVAHSIQRRRPAPGDGDAALLTTYMLAAMADELTRKLIVLPDAGFIALLDRMGATDDMLADAISVVWHRLIYGDVPAEADLSKPAERLAHFLTAAD